MSSLIIALNMIGACTGAVGVIMIIRTVKKEVLFWQSGIFLSISVLIVIFVAVANVLEYSGINPSLDRYEEYFELLVIPSMIIFFYSVVTENELQARRKNEEHLKTLLDERTLFIRELHHRIKNNLQIIMSMLNLQMGTVNDAGVESALGTAINRIGAMGFVENYMYNTDNLSGINLESCFSEVAESLIEYFSPEPGAYSINISKTGIRRDIDTAVYCCIIINELISNVFKYASVDSGKTVKMDITVSDIDGDEFMINFSDNGPGLDADISIESSPGIGLSLVGVIVNQLAGTVEIGRESGTAYKILMHSKKNEDDRWKRDLIT